MADSRDSNEVLKSTVQPTADRAVLPTSYILPESIQRSKQLSEEPDLFPKSSPQPGDTNASLRVVSNRPPSFRSTGSRGGSCRHVLLKTGVSYQQAFEKDLPVPPILTQADPMTTAAVKAEGDSDPLTFSDTDESKRPEAVCFETVLQSPDAHSELCHRGLASSADLCNAGAAVHGESPIETPEKQILFPNSVPADVLIGRVFRTLPDGDVCEVTVDVCEHLHGHHSAVMKVRPAMEFSYGEDNQKGRLGVSKVRPAGEGDMEVIHQSESSLSEVSSAAKPYSLVHDHDGHCHQSKVRSLLDRSALLENSPGYVPTETHGGHIWIEKVQSFHDAPAQPISTDTDLHSLPRLVTNNPLTDAPQQTSETSKAANYWGFLPRFREKRQHPPAASETMSKLDQDRLPDLENVPQAEIKREAGLLTTVPTTNVIQHGASVSVSPVSYKSTVSGPEDFTAPPPAIGQMYKPQVDELNPIITQRSLTTNVLQERLRDLERAQERRRKTVSSDSDKPPREIDPEPTQHRFLQGGLDPKRTAQWLRDLLNYREPYASKLTQLPERQHPRHQEHHDYPATVGSGFGTRVTTFSDENAADAGAMSQAMQNLEQLLSEALDIANHVAEHGERHVDDGHLFSSQTDIAKELSSSSYSPSMHESLQGESTAEDEHGSFGDLIRLRAERPVIFVGAVEGFAHGCEAIPLRSVKRRGIMKPDVHSGNISGPMLPGRESSLRNRKHVGISGIGELRESASPFLPMPPPDCQLKRQCMHPMPHAYDEDDPITIVQPHTKAVPNSREVREYIRVFHTPPITPRISSRSLRHVVDAHEMSDLNPAQSTSKTAHRDADVSSLDGGASDDFVQFSTPSRAGQKTMNSASRRTRAYVIPAAGNTKSSHKQSESMRGHELQNISLRGRSHVSIRDASFSLAMSNRRQPIARDWSCARKRFVATVACISTALIGTLIGIYAGIVPSVQYYIADFNHYAILGNVVLYLGMALPNFFCWPLPLLHGRKPYILSGLTLAMPLLFPQAIAVSFHRSPKTATWRWVLLLPRAFMGISLGFVNLNFQATLTDLFGASLMSSNPHQEVVDDYDVRRHGGGLGVWLGIWTWCFIGSLGLGFLTGALVIDRLNPSWGFYISIILIALVLMLNVLTPEVRRAAWRRSVAEVRTGDRVSRRVARGEIMMHRVKDGPKWWGQELWHGAALSLEMLRQPGFAVMAVYSAWIYAQVVLIIVLLGSLASKYYRLRSTFVGIAVSSVAIGALAAVPFQKANLFSRARYNPQLSNQMTVDKKITWTSHLVRRVIFTIILPVAGVMYAVVSFGPPIHLFFPCFFAAMDCSDLQIGMTGRSKGMKNPKKKINYSSFPRVQAGYAIIHSLGFIFAAGATGIGGMAQRSLGQRTATAVVASILLGLTVLLLGVLVRFRQVQIIPRSKTMEMDRWTEERRNSVRRRASQIAAAKASGRKNLNDIPEEDIGWRPLIIGNPLEKQRRMNVLEHGHLTRWTEIRKKNRLIDEGAHLNRRVLELARNELEQRGHEVLDDLQRGGAMVGELVRKVSKRSMRNKRNQNPSEDEASTQPQSQEVAPITTGSGHNHPTHPANTFAERECIMGQSVHEEAETSSVDGAIDDGHLRHRSRGHSSHAMSKVRPYDGFEVQELSGGRRSPEDFVVVMEGSHRQHHSHVASKVEPADPEAVRHREAHGAHTQGKVKPAGM
ncbi:hypothetical protein BJ170DRAFT_679529 [Xylariales sp. AK1849]|nr:hypothetical protein BJ170DRAFT_679529 [Xylariales sp. AK1849]